MHKVYRSYGYGEWEDEVLAVFATSWSSKPGEVKTLLREMFEEHTDIHDLICYLMRRRERRRPKKDAPNKVILEEFLKWKKERANNLPE